MRKGLLMIVVALLALFLASCEGYTTRGEKSTVHHSGNSGGIETSLDKANGTTTHDITEDIEELDDLVSPGDVLEVDVTLAVGKGSFKIELLGEDDQVMLTLEARDMETVSEHGQMVVNDFGDARYRVTATEAENVDYVIEYTLP